ncbi:hypothetical protein EXIGLDRAFT_693263 [Exidia glandulosa HHB12029]|uniref:Uncharacterized protein n=1 Tax=Exidia glandulosa HHB12029 TaxID=1314781 RepID=A0A166AH99_EXIGL|nr:hypothetical protein EXIGLDRAFT_693263 [Exidia glandulosa HHB12029]
MPNPTAGDVVVQDGDSRIAFSPADDWQELQAAGWYSGGTMAISWNESASISFSFVGSYIWYFGDLNYDHGRFKISIDSQPGTTNTSYDPNNLAVRSLFSQSVDPGPHSVEITNVENMKATVLDYFVFTPHTAENPGISDVKVMADDYSVITYSHPAQWTVGVTGPAYHLTFADGASVSFTFTGEYVWFYADRNTDHGPFLASIDGEAATRFSSYSVVHTDVEPLFSRAVSPGKHTLTITNAGPGMALGISWFQ